MALHKLLYLVPHLLGYSFTVFLYHFSRHKREVINHFLLLFLFFALLNQLSLLLLHLVVFSKVNFYLGVVKLSFSLSSVVVLLALINQTSLFFLLFYQVLVQFLSFVNNVHVVL